MSSSKIKTIIPRKKVKEGCTARCRHGCSNNINPRYGGVCTKKILYSGDTSNSNGSGGLVGLLRDQELSDSKDGDWLTWISQLQQGCFQVTDHLTTTVQMSHGSPQSCQVLNHSPRCGKWPSLKEERLLTKYDLLVHIRRIYWTCFHSYPSPPYFVSVTGKIPV